MAKSWFQIFNKADAPAAEIFLYDEIGIWGITAKDFAGALKEIPKDRDITLRINSPGGSIVDGFAVYSLLSERRDKVTAQIDGLAASMASLIPLAAKRVLTSENSFWMIHDPWGGYVGTSEDLRKAADVLDKMKDTSVAAYAKRTGKSEAVIAAAMANETWFTAQEAVDFGLADEVTQPVKAAASFDLRRFKNAPGAASSKAEGQKPAAPTTTEPKHPNEPMFETLLKALVEAKLIPSAKLDDKEAAAAFEASWSSHNKAKADDVKVIEGLNAKIADFNSKEADAFVAELVREGKITDDATQKASIKSLFMKDPEASRTWAGTIKAQQKPKATAGGAPLPAAKATGSGDGELSLTQRCMAARGVK